MMQNADIWLTPLILLPGIGLLIMSTAARFSQLLAHVPTPAQDGHDVIAKRDDHIWPRLYYFRNALASLYLSAGIFTLASLLHGLFKIAAVNAMWLVLLLSFGGFGCLLFACYQLFRESLICLHGLPAQEP